MNLPLISSTVLKGRNQINTTQKFTSASPVANHALNFLCGMVWWALCTISFQVITFSLLQMITVVSTGKTILHFSPSCSLLGRYYCCQRVAAACHPRALHVYTYTNCGDVRISPAYADFRPAWAWNWLELHGCSWEQYLTCSFQTCRSWKRLGKISALVRLCN